MRAMICRIVQRAFIDGRMGSLQGEAQRFCDRQPAHVDSTLNKLLLSAKALPKTIIYQQSEKWLLINLPVHTTTTSLTSGQTH